MQHAHCLRTMGRESKSVMMIVGVLLCSLAVMLEQSTMCMAFRTVRGKLPPGVVDVGEVANVEETLAFKLWNLEESKQLVRRAEGSVFIQGILEDGLSATQYGVYELQDIVYMENTMENYDKMSACPNNSAALKSYFEYMASSTRDYVAAQLQLWHLSQPACVRLDPSASDYISFLQNVVADHWDSPGYFALANYPCYNLFPALSLWLKERIKPDNVFMDWIVENSDTSDSERMAAVIESVRDSIDEGIAKDMFLSALEFEVEFFNSIGRALFSALSSTSAL